MPAEDATREIRDRTQQLPRTIAARQTRRVAVGILGGLLLAAGLLGVALPLFPGWPLLLVGLTVLSWEFRWAKRLRLRMHAKVQELREKRRRREARRRAGG